MKYVESLKDNLRNQINDRKSVKLVGNIDLCNCLMT